MGLERGLPQNINLTIDPLAMIAADDFRQDSLNVVVVVFVDQLGVEQCVEQLGVELVVEQLGVKHVVEQLGVDKD